MCLRIGQQNLTTVVGLLLILQPTLALVWEVVIFGKLISLPKACGILLVLVAIYIASYRC